MPHTFLFHLEGIAQDEGQLRLTGEEHHHLSRVVRMRAGERTFVTDGAGRLAECEVSTISRDATELRVLKLTEEAPPPLPTLALGCIKKERFERAVAHGTELGMARCIPVISHHAASRPYNDQFIERLRAIALSAMKQSFRTHLPVIEFPIAFDQLIERMQAFSRVVVGSAEAEPAPPTGAGEEPLLVVGPEAGFSLEEQQRLKAAGAGFISASSKRLRSETAAIALLTLLNLPALTGQSD